MSLLKLFKRTKSSEQKRDDVIEAISGILRVQLTLADSHSIGTGEAINKKALGYICGFIDATLEIYKFDTSNSEDRVLVIYHVFKNLYPTRETEYMDFLLEYLGDDEEVMSGYKHGLEQGTILFIEGADGAPIVGLTQILLGGEGDELAS